MRMLLPTKGISAERALLTVGSQILEALSGPSTVSSLWDRFSREHQPPRGAERVTFDWFSTALATLHAMGLVEWSQSGYLRRSDVH